MLCYDPASASKLVETVTSGKLEPHPVSGEVEIDWDYDTEIRFRRLDEETLQALVVLTEIGIAFRLVHCVGDAEGNADGWRIGEVTVTLEQSLPLAEFGGFFSIAEAEQKFTASQNGLPNPVTASNGTRLSVTKSNAGDEDDGYWDQYDKTPGARTPSQKPSPGPGMTLGSNQRTTDDADYFSQYDGVQPAMDNYDPDEDMGHQSAAAPAPPLGLDQDGHAKVPSVAEAPLQAFVDAVGERRDTRGTEEEQRSTAAVYHPRPESSAGSVGSQTVAKLEETAGRQEQNEFGVRQHVSRSIRSLFQLSQASGIDRDEFEDMVKRELDLLGMMMEGED